MNMMHLTFPMVALAIAAILLGAKRNDISEMREANDQLRERIANARLVDAGRDAARSGARKEPVAWDHLAAMFRGGGDDNSVGALSLKRRLLTMDSPELLAELDRISEMDLDDKTRQKLEMLILETLATIDPAAALQRFKGALQVYGSPEVKVLSNALGIWLKRDLTAAIGWLDREAGMIESTQFSQGDLVRLMLESVVTVNLMTTDPEQAGERLSRLPPGIAPKILGMLDQHHKLTPEDEITLAEIARKHLVQDERRRAIGLRAGNVIKKGGDYAAVDTYLNTINAAPDERESGKAHAGNDYARSLAATGKLTAQEIEEMRKWMAPDAAGSVESTTGEALGIAVGGIGGMSIEESSTLVLGYHERSGDDSTLVSYLLNLPFDYRKHPEARKVAEKITDPNREQLLLGL